MSDNIFGEFMPRPPGMSQGVSITHGPAAHGSFLPDSPYQDDDVLTWDDEPKHAELERAFDNDLPDDGVIESDGFDDEGWFEEDKQKVAEDLGILGGQMPNIGKTIDLRPPGPYVGPSTNLGAHGGPDEAGVVQEVSPRPGQKGLKLKLSVGGVKRRIKTIPTEEVGSMQSALKDSMAAQKATHDRNISLPTKSTFMEDAGLEELQDKRASASDDPMLDVDTHPVRRALEAVRLWGREWFDWEPEVIRAEIESRYGEEPEPVVLHQLLSDRVLKTTPRFFDDPMVFEKVCAAYSGREPNWSLVQQSAPHEMAAVVAIVRKYYEPEMSFSSEVAAYVAASCLTSGLACLPEELTFCNGPFSARLLRMDPKVASFQNDVRECMSSGTLDWPQSVLAQVERLMLIRAHVSEMTSEGDD